MKVNILGRTYKIKYTTQKKMLENMGSLVFGYCDLENDLIFIDKSLNDEKKEITLKHELVHCILHRIGADQVIPHEVQEILCESIANSFYELDEMRRKQTDKLSRENKDLKEVIELIKCDIS